MSLAFKAEMPAAPQNLAKGLARSPFSLGMFAWATYELMANGRPPYNFDHFVHDVTFGWKGVKYTGCPAAVGY